MPLESALSSAIEWLVESRQILVDPTFESSMRLRQSAALQSASLEHSAAVVLLVKSGLPGSASALLRPQYEALVRGLWLHRCASDQWVEKFARGHEPPKVGVMIAALENQNVYGSSLRKFKEKLWFAFNEFTHNGKQQVVARIASGEIKSNFSDRQKVSFVRIASMGSLLAASEVAAICDDEQMGRSLLEAYRHAHKSA